jgi:hypothetical protein
VARFVLAGGLLWAAGQSLSHGGPMDILITGAELAVAVTMVRGPKATAILAVAALLLLPGAFTIVWHWTSGLPVACSCARPAHPSPGLVSLTGGSFVAHIVLIALAVYLARRKDRDLP